MTDKEFIEQIAPLVQKYAKAYVIGEEGEWYKIWGSGEIGFVKKTFLRPTGRTETVELY